jgi:hypothetical protein
MACCLIFRQRRGIGNGLAAKEGLNQQVSIEGLDSEPTYAHCVRNDDTRSLHECMGG